MPIVWLRVRTRGDEALLSVERGIAKAKGGEEEEEGEGIMICNNRGNDRSKLTAQLATYPFGGAFLTSRKGSTPNPPHAHEYDRNTKETSAVDRLFSGRVPCRGKHEQTVLAARAAEGRTSGAAIKGNKGFFDGGRANNLKSCVSHRAGGTRSSDIVSNYMHP